MGGDTMTVALSDIVRIDDLTGRNGFMFYGSSSTIQIGHAVSIVGDLNGDGYDELAVSSPYLTVDGMTMAGAVYVIFGGPDIEATNSYYYDGFSSDDGFVFEGVTAVGWLGYSVKPAGDLDDDGYDDFFVSSESGSGDLAVIYGSATLDAAGSFALDDLDGTNGFRITSTSNLYYAAKGFQLGDVNNDGTDDYAVTVSHYDHSTGRILIVYGGQQLDTNGVYDIDQMTTANGFIIDGADDYSYTGKSIDNAGDVNGDGIDDIIIGAWGNDGAGPNEAGEAYIVFGGNDGGEDGVLPVSSLDGTNGMVISGDRASGRVGFDVSGIGDFNGDGIDDVLIGSPGGFGNTAYYVGFAYIMFGTQSLGEDSQITVSDLADGTAGIQFIGLGVGDLMGREAKGIGDVNGDGYADIALAATGYSSLGASGGDIYVIFGGPNVASSGEFNLSEIDGVNGYTLSTLDAVGALGNQLTHGGDLNGDGLSDFGFGALGANSGTGAAGVVFGQRNYASAANDRIIGRSGADELDGLEGHDLMDALDGMDTVSGGLGNDTIFAGSEADLVDGGGGDDFIFGELGQDTITGDAGADTIIGGDGNDLIEGGEDGDLIYGDEMNTVEAEAMLSSIGTG